MRIQRERLSELLEAVNEYYHNHGEYPDVVISSGFYEEHADEIMRLADTANVDIKDEVDDWRIS